MMVSPSGSRYVKGALVLPGRVAFEVAAKKLTTSAAAGAEKLGEKYDRLKNSEGAEKLGEKYDWLPSYFGPRCFKPVLASPDNMVCSILRFCFRGTIISITLS